jgi:hypothetical protein
MRQSSNSSTTTTKNKEKRKREEKKKEGVLVDFIPKWLSSLPFPYILEL